MRPFWSEEPSEMRDEVWSIDCLIGAWWQWAQLNDISDEDVGACVAVKEANNV